MKIRVNISGGDEKSLEKKETSRGDSTPGERSKKSTREKIRLEETEGDQKKEKRKKTSEQKPKKEETNEEKTP